MTDLTKSLLLGTDATGSSYHDLMRSVTVHSMQSKAGYVAPVMTGKGVLPHIGFNGTYLWSAYVEVDQHLEYAGEINSVVVETRLCYDCAYAFESFFRPHLRVWSHLTTDKPCECCGKITNDIDDIPF